MSLLSLLLYYYYMCVFVLRRYQVVWGGGWWFGLVIMTVDVTFNCCRLRFKFFSDFKVLNQSHSLIAIYRSPFSWFIWSTQIRCLIRKENHPVMVVATADPSNKIPVHPLLRMTRGQKRVKLEPEHFSKSGSPLGLATRAPRKPEIVLW